MSNPNEYSKNNIDLFPDIFVSDNTEITNKNISRVDSISEEPNLSAIHEQVKQSQESVATASIDQIPSEQSKLVTKKRLLLLPIIPASSSSCSEISTTTKKIKTMNAMEKTAAILIDLPQFLTREYQLFDHTMQSLLDRTASLLSIEQLRKIAQLKYSLALNDLDKSLWTIYLRSGTGHLEILSQSQEKLQQQQSKAITTATSSHSSLQLWLPDVKKTMYEHDFVTQSINEINDDDCLKFVSKMFHQFRDENIELTNQLQEHKQHLNHSWTSEIELAIDQFVEQNGIRFRRILVDRQISLVKYKYKDRAIELEFDQQNPCEYQAAVFQNLSQYNYAKENAKLELTILKQRLIHNLPPISFDSLHTLKPMALDTIQDDNVRHRLTKQYTRILQRTQSDLMRINIEIQEAKVNELRKKFNIEYAEMMSTLRFGSLDKNLTSIMIDLLRKRNRNINQHLREIYINYKRLFPDRARMAIVKK